MQIYDGRESFYQWDLNQKITSDKFQVGEEIHFHNIKQPNALITIAYDLGGKIVADVPNILLQSSYSITAYRYIEKDDGALTIEERVFTVKQRAKPSDYIYTETEVLNYKSLDDRITALERSGGGGFSPTVAITPIENGHRVTITDIQGEHSFDVLNGEKGEQGIQGERGEQGLQGVQGEKGDKGDKGDTYVLTEADKQSIVQDVINALPNGDEVSY